jgi:hypothetical protein
VKGEERGRDVRGAGDDWKMRFCGWFRQRLDLVLLMKTLTLIIISLINLLLLTAKVLIHRPAQRDACVADHGPRVNKWAEV